MKPSNISDTDWKILKEKYEDMDWVLEKLNNHYPVQYLIGNVPFLNTLINVDERCLIPRFETEEFVSKLIVLLQSFDNPHILDLGSGSGCISIALKKNLGCVVTAVDNSLSAISIMKENALLNDVVLDEIIFSDMRDISYEGYDVIVSNPPYVSYGEEVGLEVMYEPEEAIFAPFNGLYFYEEILKKVLGLTSKPKLIAFEIGYQQGDVIRSLAGDDYTCEIVRDLAGKDRFAFLYKK